MTATSPLTVPPETFRAVLGRVPTGVMVITTTSPTGQQARTANSFTSVSLEPPLVSVCFSDKSPFTAALRASGLWGVSILAADQHHLSVHFAHRSSTKDLAGIPHTLGPHTGAALLADCVATLECRSLSTHPAGDHTLLIGQVLTLHPLRNTTPLLFYRSHYHTVGTPVAQ